jgi:hypothetical protein
MTARPLAAFPICSWVHMRSSAYAPPLFLTAELFILSAASGYNRFPPPCSTFLHLQLSTQIHVPHLQGVRYAVGKQAEVLNSIIIPEIPNPPPSMVDLAQQREAPQAEQMLEDQTNRQAYTSRAGPSRSGVLVSAGKRWEETEAGTSGSEGDTWQGRIGSKERAGRPGGSSRGVTGMLEDALSAPEGVAWINSLEGNGRNGRMGETSTSYSRVDGAVSISPEMEESASGNGKQEQRQAGIAMERAAQREAEGGYPKAWRHVPLKEAVGHSKVEVAVGGVAGVVLAFLFHATVFGGHF